MDILAVGEPLLEFNTRIDGARPIQDDDAFTVGYGGDTSNFAVAAARSGARAGYVTRIGDDDFGAALVRMWEREGVGTDHVVREAGGRTGIYFVSRTEAESRFVYYRADSPASRLAPQDIPVDAVSRARLVHLSGITQAISPSACDAGFHAMELARRAGALVSYDPNLRPALWPAERARAVIMRAVELCDIALPNLTEGRALTGADDPRDVLAAFVRRGPSIVVLKMGAEGALVAHEGTVTRIDPHPVRQVDPTGAGDTFDGAFAARLLDGEPVPEAARYAAVAAALTTTGPGAVTPIPRRGTVDAALAGGHRPVQPSRPIRR
ncbi:MULTISPECIES: sugar kinase [Actinomadura]|uniref:sugar kinase n=1 Tax=Actinomadura TaxID=1988 RepID=UPI001BE3DCA8|nr:MULTISPECIES: sugar kinase [Actinomadura]MBT2212280.1 sugar kinase [Actinomadura sp. NEAU-AAG7]